MSRQIPLINRYDEAVELLPYNLRAPARLIDEADKAAAEEFRFRMGQSPAIVLPEGERPFATGQVTAKELTAVLEIASAVSAHAVRDSMKRGYITAKGGFRVGLGGQTVIRDGEVSGFLHLSSAAIRVTKEIPGVADSFLPQLKDQGVLQSTLILSPPGGGKTTVLRDLIRRCSHDGQRVAVADERGELAALRDGAPQMDVGPRTDVLTGCPKAEAVLMLLRAMNPEIIAMDEITAPADTGALEHAANCGVTLLATAHGQGLEDLKRKPMYRRLFRKGLFQRLLVVTKGPAGRSYIVTEMGEQLC